ncbi:MAG: hypothetical protein K6F72_06925 [Bacteroidales bacterium]|nr:hypothetical protein [Bacteroidales bacterium]
MKRIAILAVMMAWAITASATSVLYFTRSQAERAVSYLNRQSELMIYCGYEYEIETYVLLNEVWAERVNSAYYELWIYGWDAYTGEEIYMPIDLQCIWLYSAGHMYNAAQYLRFRTSSTLHQPSITWTVPAYNSYTRTMHRPGYVRTYHYDVHRHGWMPPTYGHTHHHSGQHHIHPYYLRAPHTPAPQSHGTWTPGVNHPHVDMAHPSHSSSGVRPTPTTSGSGQSSQQGGASPSRSTTVATPTRNDSKPTTTTTPTRSGSNNSSTTPSRSGNSSNTSTTPSRSGNSGSNTSTTPSRSGNSNSSATTPSRNSNNNSGATTSTPSRDNKPATTTTTKSDNKNTSTPTRSGNAQQPNRTSGQQGTTTSTPTRNGGSATPTRR